MRTCFIVIILSLTFTFVKAQTTTYLGQSTNTWYVTTPTSSCNGIWAIDIHNWPCSAGCTYAAASPYGCLTSVFPNCDSIVADTLYLKLCSVPCNLVASCGSSYGTCGTGTPSTTTEVQGLNENKNFKLYPNPNDGIMTFECHFTEQEQGELIIYTLTGSPVKKVLVDAGIKSISINAEALRSGMYLYELKINGKAGKKDKLIIIK